MDDVTPADYEEIVQGLLKLIIVEDVRGDVQSYRLRKYRGKSGHEHPIDVSYQLSIGGLSVVILVECKRYQRHVGIDDVMEFAYRVRDIGAHKGVLVTTVGYQKGAVEIAKAEGIGLLVAARGELEIYMGSARETRSYWLRSLSIKFDPRIADTTTMIRRVSKANRFAFITPVEMRRANELVFVLPDDIPESARKTFERALTRRPDFSHGAAEVAAIYVEGRIRLPGFPVSERSAE